MEIKAQHRCHGGTLGYYQHDAKTTGTPMRFTVFVPPMEKKQKLPAVFFLSGLTCTEDNFTVKAGAYKMAAELGLIIIAPDTSPRGDGVADAEGYDLGKGAGFYVDATQAPWAAHYRMESYITQEFRELVLKEFPADEKRLGIMGHSMGGHGALVLALRHEGMFGSVSAFAPICAPTQCPWGQKAFRAYLGTDEAAWAAYDATSLVASGKSVPSHILIDQGTEDQFLSEQLKPELLASACEKSGQPFVLRMQAGYDHSYFFIQSFMDDHLRHHAKILGS